MFYYVNSTKNLTFYYSTDGTTLYHLDYAWEPTINTPYHIVVARSGNTLHAYINGVELGSGQSITHTLYNSNKLLYVGNDEAAAPNAREFVGYLDELAIWKGVAIPISELHPQITEIETVMMDANFTISNTSGFEPLLTHFTDTSTTTDATIDAWNWSFDDGEVSSTQSPDHTYVNNGTYSVNLTIINTSYSLVSTKIQIVTVYNLPNADFSSFNTQGTAPFTTYFYDTSTNLNSGPYTYYTDFGDGNTSTEQNLYFTWNATGTYDVKHCITDSMTTVCNNKTAYITVGAPTPPVVAPVASFYGGPQTGNVPLTVFFTDVSSNAPTSWLWEFGDGSNSTLQNPQHQYTSSGFRTVNLTATNSAGSNVTTRLKFVKVS
jgi:PKD repeat protein